MSRDTQRFLLSLFLVIGGALAAIFLPSYVLKPSYASPGFGLPVPWVGWFVAFWGVLGMFGVNVFIGGPFDKRGDPEVPGEEE
jgi:hypothetical protein